jgi:tetratricopeptide (TPR) repeat protein
LARRARERPEHSGCSRARRVLLILAATAALAGTVWVLRAASAGQRARGIRGSAEDACRRYDFLAAHARWLAYLEARPDEAEAHLLAARCARRAEFLEDYTGPHPELRESFSDHLQAARRLGGRPADLALEEALAQAQHGRRPDHEDRLLEGVRAGGADSRLVLEALAHRHLRRLQFDKALGCVESLLEADPDHALALLWRGRILDQFKQVQNGREDYEQALKVAPDFDAARYYLAESLLRSRRAPEAKAHLQVLMDRGTGNLLVRLRWAKCRIALGEEAVGQELLDAWLAEAPPKHPRLLEALEARARLALALGQPGEAEAFARRALRESPLDQYALHDLITSLNAQGRRQEARDVEEQLGKIKQDLRFLSRCREELAKNPADASLRYEIGAAYLRVGRPGEALVWLHGVLERDPKHKPTLRMLADYYAQIGNEAPAAELRRRAAGP